MRNGRLMHAKHKLKVLCFEWWKAMAKATGLGAQSSPNVIFGVEWAHMHSSETTWLAGQGSLAGWWPPANSWG